MTKVETAKREKYLVALLTSSTKTEAYKTAHISKATANRIEQDPGFIDQYNKVRRQAMTQASDKLQGLASKAVDTLATIMDQTSVPLLRKMVAIADKAVNHHEEYEPAPGEDDIFLVFTKPCDQLAEVKTLYPNIDFKIVFDN